MKTAKRGLAQVLSSNSYLTARATASDGNLQKLLDLRFEPEYAIHTAVDYGIENLKALKGFGFKIDGVTDGDKAKLIHLTHHLGSSDAKGFINNTICNARAKVLLDAQVGTAKIGEVCGGQWRQLRQRTSRLAVHVYGQPYQAVGENLRPFESNGRAHFAGCDGRST